MKFEEILPVLREGKKVTSRLTRAINCKYMYYLFSKESFYTDTGFEVLLLPQHFMKIDDWEIFDEKKPKKVKLRYLTPEQCKKWEVKNCGHIECRDCIFRSVECDIYSDDVWYLNKNLYSDEFLNQEVEIEED